MASEVDKTHLDLCNYSICNVFMHDLAVASNSKSDRELFGPLPPSLFSYAVYVVVITPSCFAKLLMFISLRCVWQDRLIEVCILLQILASACEYAPSRRPFLWLKDE